MKIFTSYKVPVPSQSSKAARYKSPKVAMFNEHEFNVYCFPMDAKYYAKHDKTIRASLCEQMTTNIISISAVFDFDYEKDLEKLVIAKQDFSPERCLKKLMIDRTTMFTEIHVIDFLKQIFQIYSDMNFLSKSIKDFSDSKLFVFETERNERFYKMEAFFCDENILTQSTDEPGGYDINDNKSDVFELGLIALRMLSKTQKLLEKKPIEGGIKPTDLDSFSISSVLKLILGRMLLADKKQRPNFAELGELYFFNPKAQKGIYALSPIKKATSETIIMPMAKNMVVSEYYSQDPGKKVLVKKTSDSESFFTQGERDEEEKKELPLPLLFEILKKRNQEEERKQEKGETKKPFEKATDVESKVEKIKDFISFLKKNFRTEETEKNVKQKANKMIQFLRQEINDTLIDMKESKFKKIFEENKKKLKEVEMGNSVRKVMKSILEEWCEKLWPKTLESEKNDEKICHKIDKFLLSIK